MATTELVQPKEITLRNVSVAKVGDRQTHLLPQLATIYYQTWQTENLCGSLTEATNKLTTFDPENAYVVIDGTSETVYALIQTLPIQVPGLESVPDCFPTYASVETACAGHYRTLKPNFVLCFSVNALPNYRVVRPDGVTVSLARFLLKSLPVPNAANKLAYSRFSHLDATPLEHYLMHLDNPQALGAVGMHEHFGGITAAIINHSRPEDQAGGGANVLILYPKNEAEKTAFAKTKAMRLLHRPFLQSNDQRILFKDVTL